MAILVYAENWDGKFKKQIFELVSYATGLSGLTGWPVVCLTVGVLDDDELSKLSLYGSTRNLVVNDPEMAILDDRKYAAVLTRAANEIGAKIVLFANTSEGKGLAPRVAVSQQAGLATVVTRLPESLSPFTVVKKVFSGKAFARQILHTEKKVLTLAQNSYEIKESPQPFVKEVYNPGALLPSGFKVKEVSKQSGKVLLTDAEIVVSGGRGMKSPDNWAPIEELAALLGAATACSRPVSDEGWRPHEEHTGQTGKIIAPNLYFAFGISGAIQHLAGVSSSRCIVAVNTDKDAPIFEAADYGIVADATKVLPDLIEAVKEIKS